MSLVEKEIAISKEKTATTLTVSRVEHKYIISSADAARLENKLPMLLQEDPHNGLNGYMVRSLYFDTARNKDYYAKEDGDFERHKIRRRIYSLEDQEIKLECKSKKGDFQKKSSIILNREQVNQLVNGNYGVLLEIETAEAVDMYKKILGYKPAVVVQYNRKAYFWHTNDTRITIDSNICGCETEFDLFSDKLPFTYATYGDTNILEVKYSGRLEPSIAKLLDGYDRTRTSFSKYNNTRRIRSLL